MNKPVSVATGTTHKTVNNGELKVTDYISADVVMVEFAETGFKRRTTAYQIRKGEVKDLFKPAVFGVGFLGEGKHEAKKTSNAKYNAWQGMLERCYCPKYQSRRPSYIGCTVTPEWHNFQNFGDWFDVNHIKGFQLDKDIKIKGNKVYSPEACQYVSGKDNSTKAQAKNFTLISPTGKTVKIYNLKKFCLDNNLHRGNMSSVASGRRKSSQGWTKP